MGFLRRLFGGGASAEKPASGDMSATLIRRLSASKHELDGLPRDRHGHARDVFLCDYLDLTGRRDKLSFSPCLDPKASVERGKSVYYLSPNEFALEFGCRDDVRVKITATLDRTTTSALPEWLYAYVTKAGEDITAEALGGLLDGKYSSERLPEWLSVQGQETFAGTKKTGEPPFAELKPGDVVFGSYRIERELGGGGQGRVLLATDTNAPTESLAHVVLKGLHGGDAVDGSALDAIIDEANILRSMRHDGIAAYYWCKMLGDVPVLAIEYIDGVSLADYLAHKSRGKISEDETRELLRPIADALDYAHRRNVFHRDVKPKNIIVRNSPINGYKTCLIDFGIAGTNQSGTSVQPIGTPRYMSPGQKLGKPPSADMDVYSLAVTAYECLTGTLPYPDGWLPGVKVPPLSSDTPFARSVMRGLEMLPENRPTTCCALINPSATRGDGPGRRATGAPGTDNMSALEETFKKYRKMLAESAQQYDGIDHGLSEWFRVCQARLRDLTTGIGGFDEVSLERFFAEVRNRRGRVDAIEFFYPDGQYATLLGLGHGLPKTGGRVWLAIKESIGNGEWDEV